jgi:hypothetical protein
MKRLRSALLESFLWTVALSAGCAAYWNAACSAYYARLFVELARPGPNPDMVTGPQIPGPVIDERNVVMDRGRNRECP